MLYQSSVGLKESDILSLAWSPFLVASLLFHALFFLLAIRAATLTIVKADTESLIPVRLVEPREGGAGNKSIGPATGPGGPRRMPKSGTIRAPAERSGKKDTGSLEASVPSKKPVEAAPQPEPAPLPRPKVLASKPRSGSFTSTETFPDSLVRLPTDLGRGASTDVRMDESGARPAPGLSANSEAIKALKEGTEIPGALKATGSAIGSEGVPGGHTTGTGLAGAGTGRGAGGGSLTGLRGLSSADYDQYLTQLKKRVESVWKFPQGVSGVQKVSILFTLDRAGKLVQSEVLDSTDPRMNASALEAMKRASPFAPIPERLKDLANTPLRMQFTVTVGLRG